MAQTRSGRVYSRYAVYTCPPDFDFEALALDAARCEEEGLGNNSSECSEPEHKPVDSGILKAASAIPEELADLYAAPLSCEVNNLPSPSTPMRKRKRDEDTGISKANLRHLCRQEKAKAADGHCPSQHANALLAKAASIPAVMDCIELPAAQGAYVGKTHKFTGEQAPHTKEELVNKHGFSYIPWNGIDPALLVDSTGRVFASLVGRPCQECYVQSAEQAHDLLMAEGKAAGLVGPASPHLRGHFHALNVGLMHGKGTQHPVNMNFNNNVTTRLLNSRHFRNLAGFASSSFSRLALRLHQMYSETIQDLYGHDSCLRRIFPANVSVFPTAAFNFGPNVWTYPHCDAQNLANRWCSIQALGRFDPAVGGHLVLWEPRLVIEFPPGALALIPSAVVTHSNIPVLSSESQTSFTQYAPGGLFRYVDYDFHTEKELKANHPDLHKKKMDERPERWRSRLGMFSTLEEIRTGVWAKKP